MKPRCTHLAFMACLAIPFWPEFGAPTALADEVDDDLAAIASAAPLAAGSAEARAACDRLVRHGTEVLPRVLTAMDTPNPVAANWCRTVFDTIVTEEMRQAEPRLPLEFFKEFAADSHRRGKTRRLVLQLLDRVQPDFRQQLLAGALDDPEFRLDAVALVLAAGDAAKAAGDQEAAHGHYRRAFSAARDPAQVAAAASKLRDAGGEANVIAALGLVVDWYFVGPFPAPGYSGFRQSFAPQESEQVDLTAAYELAQGEPLRWKRYSTPDALGQINLVQAIAPAAEAVGYGYTEIESAGEQNIQVRCGADDNLSVWLNGQKILAREQWLNGTRFDRFVAPAKLLAGKNRLLVKICQGPQHKDPAVPNNWSMQLRLCDESGAGVEFRSLLMEEGAR
ncbi:MAG: hypothetical protein AB7O62_08860 [Pirellulales bacterium]